MNLSASLAVLEAFHCCLNSKLLVPERAYRRNSTSYILVSYTNNIIGLLLSQNFEPISLFVARASEHIRDFPPKSRSDERYYGLVTNYLSHVVFHMSKFTQVRDFDGERISQEILSAGPQLPPSQP